MTNLERELRAVPLLCQCTYVRHTWDVEVCPSRKPDYPALAARVREWMRERKVGIVWAPERHGFLYGWDRGHLQGWPNWTRTLIVNVVNRVCCTIYGHNRELEGIVRDDGTFPCTMCSTRLIPS